MTTSAMRPHRGHLARYSLWQFRDYAMEKGIGTALVAVLAGYLSYTLLQQQLGHARMLPQGIYDTVLQQLLSNLVFVGALFAGNGIVSDDRKNGFYRFYFAKPVDMLLFYIQKFAVAMLGFLLITALLMPAWMHWFRQPMPPWTLLVGAATGFMLYAGIGFLLSAFVRTDWLSFVAVYLAAKIAWMQWGTREDWVGKLVHLLPPVGDAQISVLEANTVQGTIPWRLVAWVGGYGLAALVLGLVALRKRPIGSHA